MPRSHRPSDDQAFWHNGRLAEARGLFRPLPPLRVPPDLLVQVGFPAGTMASPGGRLLGGDSEILRAFTQTVGRSLLHRARLHLPRAVRGDIQYWIIDPDSDDLYAGMVTIRWYLD